MRRRALLGAGLLAAGVGFATARLDGVGGAALTTPLLAALWTVAAVGVVLAVLDRLTASTPGRGRLPAASERPAYPTPGGGLRARVSALGPGEDDAEGRDRVRERIRQTAVRVLTREGDPLERARERLADGRWTDDETASALFTERGRHDHVETGFHERVVRAMAAIADRAGHEPTAGESVTSKIPDAAEGDAGPTVGRGEERLERTGRWRGVQALALAGAALGVVLGSAAVVLTGVVGVGFAAYSRLWTAPEPEIAVERSVEDSRPRPGDTVRVTLSVTSESDRLLPDVRLCDDVPAGLRVVDGTPRHTTALRPGKTATIAYEVQAVRGHHTFDSVTVVTRDPSGASCRTARLATDPVSVTCRPAYGEREAALGDLATLLAGRELATETGDGVAVHSLREYRRGDPLGALDWGHLAKTGTLATRRYDQPRTVRVVVLVDARGPAYVTADATRRRPAVDVCAHAAGELAAGLLEEGALVGLATLAPAEAWVPTGSGRAHRERILETVTGHESLDWTPPTDTTDPVTVGHAATRGDDPTTAAGSDEHTDGSHQRSVDSDTVAADGGDGPPHSSPQTVARESLASLTPRLPGDCQVVFCSPLTDDVAVAVAERLDARGHDVLVASPDLTTGATPADRFASVERTLRLDHLRRAGVRTVTWTPPAEQSADTGWSACR